MVLPKYAHHIVLNLCMGVWFTTINIMLLTLDSSDCESNLWNFLIDLHTDHLQTGGGCNEMPRSLDGNNTDIITPFYQTAGSANTADLQLLKKRILCLLFSLPEIVLCITCQ
jgi:hypothetical protein